MAKSKEPRLPSKSALLYKGEIKVNFYDDKKQHEYEVLEKIGKDNWRTIPDVVSVTQCTKIIDKSGPLMHWAVGLMRDDLLQAVAESTFDNPTIIGQDRIIAASKLHYSKKEEAADIGTAVHEWAEGFGQGANPELPVVDADPAIQPELYMKQQKVLNGVLAFLRWVNEAEVKFVSTERLVYSRKHNYVGCEDCEITLGRERHRILHPGDYKTAKGFYTSFRYQVAAYQQAVIEECGQEFGDKILIRFGKEDGEFDARTFGDHDDDFKYGFLPAMALTRREKQLKDEEAGIKKAIKAAEKENKEAYVSCR